ncbi:hypothetical protein M8J76_012182 [Diaphorina citri]|nr:hypothetical protein M8J75_002328 [Diaphorina citri]KAI5741286.1 hypothetical protein M8J76_012182 [Diaphorina citri]
MYTYTERTKLTTYFRFEFIPWKKEENCNTQQTSKLRRFQNFSNYQQKSQSFCNVLHSTYTRPPQKTEEKSCEPLFASNHNPWYLASQAPRFNSFCTDQGYKNDDYWMLQAELLFPFFSM